MKVEDHSSKPIIGVILKIMAIFLFTVLGAVIKATSDEVPPGQAIFFRSFFAIPVILLWLTQRRELRVGLVPNALSGHVMRGIIGCTAMGLTFTGLGMLPLPEVTAIGFAAPIFTLVLAAILLGERIKFIRLTAVAVGLVGVIIILWPRLSGTSNLEDTATIGALLILVATLMRSLVQIHIRQMVQSEHTAAIVFYFSMLAAGLSLLTIPFGWVVPSTQTIALLIMAGFIGGVAQILATSAYRYGTASMLAPYDYTSMIFAIIIGYVWFKELPTAMMLIGSALVIGAGVLVIWREHQLGLERGKTRAVTDPKA